MFRMLVHIFGRNPVPRRMGVAGQLQVFFVNLVRIAANTDTRTVAVEILMPRGHITTPPATTAARPFRILPLSHFSVINCLNAQTHLPYVKAYRENHTFGATTPDLLCHGLPTGCIKVFRPANAAMSHIGYHVVDFRNLVGSASQTKDFFSTVPGNAGLAPRCGRNMKPRPLLAVPLRDGIHPQNLVRNHLLVSGNGLDAPQQSDTLTGLSGAGIGSV